MPTNQNYDPRQGNQANSFYQPQNRNSGFGSGGFGTNSNFGAGGGALGQSNGGQGGFGSGGIFGASGGVGGVGNFGQAGAIGSGQGGFQPGGRHDGNTYGSTNQGSFFTEGTLPSYGGPGAIPGNVGGVAAGAPSYSNGTIYEGMGDPYFQNGGSPYAVGSSYQYDPASGQYFGANSSGGDMLPVPNQPAGQTPWWAQGTGAENGTFGTDGVWRANNPTPLGSGGATDYSMYPTARGDGSSFGTAQEISSTFRPAESPPTGPPAGGGGIQDFLSGFGLGGQQNYQTPGMFDAYNAANGISSAPPQQQRNSVGYFPEQQGYQTPGMFDAYNAANGISSAPPGLGAGGWGIDPEGPRGERSIPSSGKSAPGPLGNPLGGSSSKPSSVGGRATIDPYGTQAAGPMADGNSNLGSNLNLHGSSSPQAVSMMPQSPPGYDQWVQSTHQAALNAGVSGADAMSAWFDSHPFNGGQQPQQASPSYPQGQPGDPYRTGGEPSGGATGYDTRIYGPQSLSTMPTGQQPQQPQYGPAGPQQQVSPSYPQGQPGDPYRTGGGFMAAPQQQQQPPQPYDLPEWARQRGMNKQQYETFVRITA